MPGASSINSLTESPPDPPLAASPAASTVVTRAGSELPAEAAGGGSPGVPAAAEPGRAVLPFPGRIRLLMVLFGFIPVLHFVAVLGMTLAPLTERFGYRTFLLGLGVLYVLPPAVVRGVAVFAPTPRGRFDVNSGPFLLWWFGAQWQVIFNRLPFLEELLRMFPGLYSLWLRGWGARVGKLVYWSPGFALMDRPLMDVGDHVVFGAGVRIATHLLSPDAAGRLSLTAAPVRVGSGTLVGAYCLLGPGSRIAANQMLPALRTLHPFAAWEDGRRAARNPSHPGGEGEA